MIVKRALNTIRYYRHKSAFAMLTAAMIFIAFFGGMTGIMAVSIKEDLGLLDTALSTVFFASSLGFMLFTFLAGKVASRYGYRRAYVMGFALVSVSGLLMPAVNSLWQLVALCFVQGAGFSTLTISSNSIIPVLFCESAVTYMNLFHLFYALGSAVSKPVIGSALSFGVNWRILYGIGAIVSAVFLAVMLRMKLPGPSEQAEPNKAPSTQGTLRQYAKSSLFWVFILIMGSYLISESLTTNWFVNYAWEGFGVDTGTGANHLFAFFLCSTVGKLLFPPLMKRWGERYMIPAFALAAGLFTLGGVALGRGGLWLIAGAGLFFSVIYPTILVRASASFPGNTSAVLGTMGMMANMLTMLSDLAVGSVNVLLGARISYLIIPLALFTVCGLTLWMARKPTETKSAARESAAES